MRAGRPQGSVLLVGGATHTTTTTTTTTRSSMTSNDLSCSERIRTGYKELLTFRNWITGDVEYPTMVDVFTLDVEPVIRLAASIMHKGTTSRVEWSRVMSFYNGKHTRHYAQVTRRVLLRHLDVDLRRVPTGTLTAWHMLARDAHLYGCARSQAELDAYWYAEMLLKAAVTMREAGFYAH